VITEQTVGFPSLKGGFDSRIPLKC